MKVYLRWGVTTGQLNDYIGKAKNGDKYYAQFKNKEDQLMSAGLMDLL